MLTTHGQNWEREAYAPSSWICPLCNNDDTMLSVPDKLACHLAENHGKSLTQLRIQAVVMQSRIRTLRPPNECHLCYRDKEDKWDASPKKNITHEEEESGSEKSRDDADLHRGLKRTRTERGYMEVDQHVSLDRHPAAVEQQQETKPQANSHPDKYPTVGSFASHVAGHLQAIMALTLRIISIDSVEMCKWLVLESR